MLRRNLLSCLSKTNASYSVRTLRMNHIIQIKIFGERNTGTNWLEKIILANYDIPLIHHQGIINREITAEQKSFLNQYSKELRAALRERLIDNIFESQKAKKLFGWKHSAVHYSYLSKVPLFKKTGFIFLVKNPYSFLKSLHVRPYHSLVKVPKNLDEFVLSPWMTVHRDYTLEPLLKSPLELWNLKTSSYLSFMKKYENCLILRYEDLLEDYDLIFRLIKQKFSIQPILKLKITNSTKDQELKLADYQKKYLEYDPQQGFEIPTLDFIQSSLNRDLIDFLEYKL